MPTPPPPAPEAPIRKGSPGPKGAGPLGLEGIPGATTSIWLLASLAVMVAVFSGHPHYDPVLRTLWFAVLSGFFHGIASRARQQRPQPLGWIALGFGVLTVGHGVAAAVRLAGLDSSTMWDLLAVAMERGAVYLLGLSLISFGILGWVPQLLTEQEELQVDVARTQGELRTSERARHRLEHRMVEAERLRTTGELAAGVAHDLRNPLAIVKAAAESLVRKDRTADDHREHVEVILRNVGKATRTITSMLELGRPSPASVGPVPVSQLLQEVLDLVAVEARRREVSIRVKNCSEDPLAIVDRGLAIQALLNLVLNGIQFSPAGSDLGLRTRMFRANPSASGALGDSLPGLGLHGLDGDQRIKCCAIAVEDSGPGVPPEIRRKVFRPFFTTREGGTGLGLLSARSLAEKMGGRLGLAPRGRGGARAVLLLPLASEDSSAETPQASDSQHPSLEGVVR